MSSIWLQVAGSVCRIVPVGAVLLIFLGNILFAVLPKINLCLEGSGERDDVIARYHCWSQGTAWWERSPFHLAITHATAQVCCSRRPEIQIKRLARL